jgi:hypothetical protein
MEKVTINNSVTTTYLSGTIHYDKSREYLEYPVEKQRFLFYHNRISEFTLLKMIETETFVYWIEDRYRPMFTTKLFYLSKGLTGITLDKKTKNVKIWFGKYPNEKLIESFYAYHNINPDEILSHSFKRYFTKSLAKDIAKGKIHSVNDYALFLSKKTMFFKGIDPKLLSKLIYNERMKSIDYYTVDIKDLSRILQITEDKESMITFIMEHKGSFWNLVDLAREAISLNEKINVTVQTDITFERERLNSLSKRLYKKFNINNGLPF